ncbi:hypothetical protein B0H14DRAFT_3740695 [Mycena olivaceomarginata]|nr:hypothetical protein B0H14DRAFT_3740695 [Mycena olivaceomarginata]
MPSQDTDEAARGSVDVVLHGRFQEQCAGKSSIPQFFCHRLEEKGGLGGAFFFKRGEASRGNGNKLFSTIAYQLSRCLPKLKHAISLVVENDPSIADRSLSIQLQRLIIEPCRQNLGGRPLAIIIDGLDECQDIQQEILQSSGSVIQEAVAAPLFCCQQARTSHSPDLLSRLRMSGSIWSMNYEFTRIHREHKETIVRKSSGYFIYATTIIKSIDDKDFRPTERLEVIMGMKGPDFGVPFAALDQVIDTEAVLVIRFDGGRRGWGRDSESGIKNESQLNPTRKSLTSSQGLSQVYSPNTPEKKGNPSGMCVLMSE